MTDGGVVTRYVADKSGTLTLADGSKWAKAEDPAGAVSFRLAAAIGPDEAQAAIGLRAERVTFSTAGRTHVVNANDYEPVNHLILLSEAKTSLNVDLSGLPLQRKFFFANGSTVLGAMAYFDCGSDVYLTGTITAATVVNNRTFVLPPGFAARVERLGGTLTLVEIIPKAAYGTVTYNWVHKPDGTYRVTYVRPKSLAFAPGAETGVLGLSSFQSLDSATVISITMGPRDDGGPVPPNPVVVSKMGSVTGLNPWEFKLRNTSASILTCDICIVFDGVTEV